MITEKERGFILRVISWLKGWNMLDEANAVVNLLTEYELLLLEVKDRRDGE